MTSAQLGQAFVCTRFLCTITRGACADRHRQFAAKHNKASGKGDYLGISSCACRSCPIGMQHARGHVADVALATVVARTGDRGKRVRRCYGCGEPLPVGPTRRGRAISTCSDACAQLVLDYARASQEHQLPECG